MTKIKKDIPPFLAKHGIKEVTDNVPDGAVVVPPTNALFMMFEEELMNSDLVKRGGTEDPSTE